MREECEALSQLEALGMKIPTDACRHRDRSDVAIGSREESGRHPVVIEARVELVVIVVCLHGGTENHGATLSLHHPRDLRESGRDAIPLDGACTETSFAPI